MRAPTPPWKPEREPVVDGWIPDRDDAEDDAWEFCPCRRNGLRATRSTEPNPKIEPDELRPNVPPRMW